MTSPLLNGTLVLLLTDLPLTKHPFTEPASFRVCKPSWLCTVAWQRESMDGVRTELSTTSHVSARPNVVVPRKCTTAGWSPAAHLACRTKCAAQLQVHASPFGRRASVGLKTCVARMGRSRRSGVSPSPLGLFCRGPAAACFASPARRPSSPGTAAFLLLGVSRSAPTGGAAAAARPSRRLSNPGCTVWLSWRKTSGSTACRRALKLLKVRNG
mmetsp:Transcript_42644/g.118749  ORF Transcript_42644/g.118749 Transcript_42644/m.118749 type:complete len:213 (+) Transcript_42644:193-831(+)